MVKRVGPQVPKLNYGPPRYRFIFTHKHDSIILWEIPYILRTIANAILIYIYISCRPSNTTHMSLTNIVKMYTCTYHYLLLSPCYDIVNVM